MIIKKWKNNPILEPVRHSDWEGAQVRNPAVVIHAGKIHLLYTAAGDIDLEHKLFIGHAVSSDGFNFERVDEQPFITPSSSEFEGFDAGGVEDPRAVKIDGTIYISYCARAIPCWNYAQGERLENPPTQGYTWTKNYRRGGLIASKDLKSYKRLGPITTDDHYDCNIILFPEKINGKYVMMHRPSGWEGTDWGASPDSKAGINICFSDDLVNWEHDQLLASPQFSWETKIGGAAPPVKTDKGWLVLYHAVETPPSDGSWHHLYRFCYRAGVMLLDLEDPTRIIARAPEYILEPETPYEKFGTVNNVVFPTGNVVVGDELFIYYGAADTVCCAAAVKIKDMLDYILKFRK